MVPYIAGGKVVEELSCWADNLKPGAEFARLAVKESCQNDFNLFFTIAKNRHNQ